MKQPNLSMLAAALVLVCSSGAMAADMSKDDYNSARDRISRNYKDAKSACGSYAGNAKDVCNAQAEMDEHVAKAKLDADYDPSLKNRYNISIATEEGNYAVAREKCNSLAGNTKDVCVQEAKAAQTSARADAEAWLKTAQANQTASDKSATARADADASKRDADYAVARERCDMYSGEAKSNCLKDAKVRFGK